MSQAVRVPVVLITGFLGSGKTTLLNRLFRARPPERGRFAIIVNEFGDVGIDGDLLPEGATRQVELPGGCVCCALVEDLKTTLVDLLDTEPQLGCVLIETTGVADPLPISWTLASDVLESRVRLAAVVTVIDPGEHEAARGQSPSVDAQVRDADLLVLSKLDLVSSNAGPPPTLVASLRERNAVAPIIARPPAELAETLWRHLEDPPLPAAAGVAPLGRGAAHDEDLESVCIPVPDILDLEELVAVLEDLPPTIIRIKGIVRAVDAESGANAPGLFVVHRVGARVSTERAPAGRTASPETRLVALGKSLDSDHLADCIRSAVLPSGESGQSSTWE
jgi:G3E family GTPase